jgi:ribosomal protein L35
MKRKTKKAALKRFTVSARGKVQHRPANQAHFNSRETGQEGHQKHRPASLHHSDRRRLLRLLPYTKTNSV